ncbi:MAG: hypothetical protein KatS3mg022_1295 [Armatimonadota bacterium]|nr:MAG: hypothetical protein KatS3mg022_1295 [Armatimonadota bacterium]
MGRKLVLYTDGSVRSGGRAGVGVVVADPDTGTPVRRFGKALTDPATVNEAEYIALLRGLRECLRLGATEVEVCLDSELVRQQVLGNWQCNHEHLRQLRDQCLELLQRFDRWELHRVPSASNPLAHTYANIASTQNRRRFFWQHPRKTVDIDETQHKTEGGNDMKLVVTAQAQTLPDDVYTVELLDVKEQTGTYGEQFVWLLRVAEGEYEGTELRAWTNASTAINAKAVRWASAFAGKPYAQGDTIDFDALQGKRARAVVQVKQTADGREFARVTDILPLKRVKHGMVAVPATKQGFYEMADDEDPDDPFNE